MHWKKLITPPHPKRYELSCASLGRTLTKFDRPPVSFVCAQCWRVIKDAFGNQWSALWWILLNIASHSRRKAKDRVWEFWQKWIMRRSDQQFQQQLNARIKKSIGVDLDQISDVVDEAEFEELLNRILDEDEDRERE